MEAKLSKVLGVNLKESLTKRSDCHVDSQTTDQESPHIMIRKMKEKIQCSNSTRAEKVQILTQAPKNWPRKKFFGSLQ